MRVFEPPAGWNIGQRVKLKPDAKIGVEGEDCVGEIKRFISDIQGGVVLSDYLAGHKYWNVAELDPA